MTAAADQRAWWLALASAATPGPWGRHTAQRDEQEAVLTDERGSLLVTVSSLTLNATADARFIAAAREAVPALIAEVEALQWAATEVAGWSQFRCSPLCHAVIEHEECTCGMVQFNAALDGLRAALGVAP